MRGAPAEAVAVADAGYAAAARSFDAPHMRFNIADAHVSALLLAGRIADALEVAERVRRQAADLPGAAQLLGAAVAGRAALGAGRLHSAGALLEQAAVGLSATHAFGWGYRYHVPRATALADAWFNRARQLPRSPRSTSSDVLSGRWTTNGAWPGRGWPRARAPSARRSPSCCRRPKGLQLTGNSRRKWSACRPPPSSVTVRAHSGCATSKRSSRGHVLASLRGSRPP